MTDLRDMPLTTPEEIIAFRREALRQTDLNADALVKASDLIWSLQDREAQHAEQLVSDECWSSWMARGFGERKGV